MPLIHAEAEFALEQWGIWVRLNRPGPRDAKSWMGPMLDRMVGHIIDDSGSPVRSWDDPVCEAFDSYVMRNVCKSNRQAFNALSIYYAHSTDEYRCTSKKELARRLHVSRATAIKRLEIGINMVAGMLAMA